MIYCLSLTLGGRVWRIASRPCDPVSLDGPLRFRGGLPPIEIEEAIELLSEGTPADLSTDILLPHGAHQLLSQGHRLDGSPIEVAEWDGVSTWEGRRRLLTGTVMESQPAAEGQPVTIRASADPGEDSAEFPPKGATLDDSTAIPGLGAFLLYDPKDDNKPYPFPFGHPGVLRKGGTAIDNAGSPAYMVADLSPARVFVLISGGVADTRPGGGVRILDTAAGTFEDATTLVGPTLSTDGRGRHVSIVHLTGAVAAGYAVGHELHAMWIGWGGVRGTHDYLHRAGDVLSWALRMSSLPVDWARTEACARTLPWALAGYWDARSSPWAWIRDALLPSLPISIARGADGLYPYRYWWEDEGPDPIAHLEDGRNCRLAERPMWQGKEQEVSEVQVRYAVSSGTQSSIADVTVSADRPKGRRQAGSFIASRAQPGSYSMTSPVIWEDVTAGVLARAILASRRARLIVPVLVHDTSPLMVGDVVDISVASYQIARIRGTIRASRRGSSWRRLEVSCLAH